MSKFFRNFDFGIVFSSTIIVSFGLATIFSVAPDFFQQQFFYWILGLVFFILFSLIDYRLYHYFSWWIYPALLIFLASTFFLGSPTRGSTRWIALENFTIQPSELVKPFLIVFFSALLSKKPLFFSIPFFLLPVFLVFKQPDLGSALSYFGFFGGMALAAGISSHLLAGAGIFAFTIIPLSWHFFLKEYQKERIVSFLNPGFDPLGSGYNGLQALIAIGAGGIFGRGLGMGTQSQLRFLPEHHTDFIFASLAEELGFVGAIILLGAYFFLFLRILKIAKEAFDKEGRLICLGVFSLLLFQVTVNIGMNLGILPITGITLPLVSSGGSSFLATMICLGIVESVARNRKTEEAVEIR
ncbi:MAG: rod shape-determining protein RodA [bacterium]|nr:rod shape-determining protein RodA [bacterium]